MVKIREKGFLNRNIILLLVGIIAVVIILFLALNKRDLFAKEPKLSEENLDLFKNRYNECRLLNPDEEDACRDRAYFGIAVLKNLDICMYIKNNELKEECIKTLK